MKKENKILVIDIPHTRTPAEAEETLNGTCDSGFYILRMCALPNEAGLRVLFMRRAKPE